MPRVALDGRRSAGARASAIGRSLKLGPQDRRLTATLSTGSSAACLWRSRVVEIIGGSGGAASSTGAAGRFRSTCRRRGGLR
jgi:hypothetical protein